MELLRLQSQPQYPVIALTRIASPIGIISKNIEGAVGALHYISQPTVLSNQIFVKAYHFSRVILIQY